MKALLIILAFATGLSLQANPSIHYTGEHKSATSTQISHALEIELLDDYFPEYMNDTITELITVQIYDSNFELVLEETINPTADVENEKLEMYLLNSDLIMEHDNVSMYMLDK